MVELKTLKDFTKDIEECVKCGACMAHCPVFGAENAEGHVARGKISLAHALLKGQVDISPKFCLDMSQCLLCGSCTNQCPNKIPTQDIVAAARREISRKKGVSAIGKGVSTLISHPNLIDLTARSTNAAAEMFFEKIPEQSGLRLKFSMPFIPKDRTLPRPAPKPFLGRYPEHIPGRAGMPKVLFFTGCGINFLYPGIGEALVKLLKFKGVHLIIPKNQGCCGLPALSAGNGPTVESLARANLDLFEQYEFDYIVTACASCHFSLTHLYPGMGGAAYKALGGKTKDILVFLTQLGLPGEMAALPRTDTPVRVTYHDPCHLRNPGITREPRQILAALPGVEFVEMAASDTCCGLGGTYSVYHYETSKKIGLKKAAAIADTKAELVATACPGCIIQLQDSLNHARVKARALHVLELAAGILDNRDLG